MQYLIIPTNSAPFFTHWCDEDKFPMEGGTAFDNVNHLMTVNGKDWTEVETDHL